MPILKNARHERFAQELAAGKSADDAYKAAGYKSSRQNAHRLSTKDDVETRVAELLSRVSDGVVLTRQWVIERLIENATRAMQSQPVKDAEGNPIGEYRYEGSVANKALELLGKEVGMFVDRVQNDNFNYVLSDEPGAEDAEDWRAGHAPN